MYKSILQKLKGYLQPPKMHQCEQFNLKFHEFSMGDDPGPPYWRGATVSCHLKFSVIIFVLLIIKGCLMKKEK